ncbi:MAG: DNA polymerase III subunit chi [Polaromonas sp.]
MTEIEFHVNVPDKLLYSCRLLRKAYLSGAKVVVTAGCGVLDELDHLLWSFSPTEFVPHCRADAPQDSLAVTPVLLAESLTACPHHGVLVNLGQDIPVGFEPFERFIEVIARAEDDLLAGRSRWKHYAMRGYALKKHERTAVGEDA